MFRNNYGLSTEEIERVAPSVMAVGAHDSRSSKYLYIPTIELLSGLRDKGYVPTGVMQSTSRIPGKAPFTKHLLRLRKSGYLGNSAPDVPEVVLVNSHDGTSAYQLLAGIFRTVCTNGLITGDIANTLKVYHKGNVMDEVFSATYMIAEEAEATMQIVTQMKQIELTPRERLLLAQYAAKARFGELEPEEEGEVGVVEGSLVEYRPESLLQPRRSADRGNDLWRTLNVVQENVLAGGIRAVGGYKRSRAIRGIDQSMKLNRLIWQFAEELRKFKSE